MDKYAGDSNLLMWLLVLVLTGFMFGCVGGNDGAGAPVSGPTGSVCTAGTGPAAPCVPLGATGDRAAAADYAILAKTGVATVPTSAVTGNVELSPAAKVFLTVVFALRRS